MNDTQERFILALLLSALAGISLGMEFKAYGLGLGVFLLGMLHFVSLNRREE